MNNFDFKPSQPETPSQPAKPSLPSKPTMPFTPSKPEKPSVPAKPTEPKKAHVDPRAAYNCPTCKGEGLVKDSRNIDDLCGNCNGTGKV